jgi:para-aminobenzoate synthetase component 1
VKPQLREIALTGAPEAIFAGLCDRPGAFFLDSGLSAGGLGRYSFIGFDPFLAFRAKDGAISMSGGEANAFHGDPLTELRRLLQRYRSAGDATVPFFGGAVGYFSYEFGASQERVSCSHPDELGLPDLEFGFYDGVVGFDRETGRAFLVANPVHRDDAEKIFRRLQAALDVAVRPVVSAVAPMGIADEPSASFAKGDYLRAVARIKDYIAAGDVYQVNLTQRFDAPLRCDPYELFWRLRRRSPAPFASYLNLGAAQLVGSSPERFLRIQNGRVETRPIKGTRPRGATPEEDTRLRAELAMSEKDRAELLMIVDLERNDLGRICEPGSIQVDELFKVETHPTVHHLVANVSGKLRAESDVFDCIRAMLPGGSITGAPKIRAMQIIDELENTRRGVYTGAVGYIGFDGNCDLNIAIRTILCAHGRAYYHVGGGIVWDSDPESEYQETLDKGVAMRAALME